jgi:thiosulfate dehydrogenase
MISPRPASADEIISSIARGGLLYDKWYKVAAVDDPANTHSAWPGSNTKKKGAVTWRCKSCHGWDYKGAAGAYGSKSSSYYTGIKGIRDMAGTSVEKVVAVLKDKTHGYTDDMLEPEDFRDLALFVGLGQVDMDNYIDRATKQPRGLAEMGEPIYNTICARCHGFDGSKPKDMDKTLGKQMGNPWEVLHKILNGHPGEKMPSLRGIDKMTSAVMPGLRALDRSVSANVLSYVGTLPKERSN